MTTLQETAPAGPPAAVEPSVRAPSPVGLAACAAVGLLLLGFAVSLDVPRTKLGFQSDEATYYSLAHSLARDGDFVFERKDLVRVWEEFPGPEGIFLKRGSTLDVRRSASFPWVRIVQEEDPRLDRLYYGKAYIYPLVAAPFVRAFGTNGFLVLHALLMTLNLVAAYVFLAARGSGGSAALGYALAFFAASVVPVYFVSLTPELFNLSLVLYAFFLWTFKEAVAGRPAPPGWAAAFLRGPGSDCLAAALLGVATFSKPTHVLLILPILLLAAARRQWRRGIAAGLVFTAVTGGLFLVNALVTGEVNYQGGYRKSFYSATGFPFANDRETFDSIGVGYATDALRTDIIAGRHTARVFGHNLVYFAGGRHSGLVPYFFPGVLSAALFLGVRRQRRAWQWMTAATLLASIVALLLYMPYTYSGGGGSVGNRYFMSFYPLFLFLTPPLAGAGAWVAAFAVGGVFTAKMVVNPFYTLFNPAEHAKAGPLRALPIERTLLNDLPVAAYPDRARRPLEGTPPVDAYFVDDNAFNPEGTAFWVKGGRRADVLLRARAVDRPDGRVLSLRIRAFELRVRNGAARNRVTIDTGAERRALDLGFGEEQILTLRADRGVPYRPNIYPTNWVYAVSIATTAGFVPFLEVAGASDSRYLGAMITITPVYGAGR